MTVNMTAGAQLTVNGNHSYRAPFGWTLKQQHECDNNDNSHRDDV